MSCLASFPGMAEYHSVAERIVDPYYLISYKGEWYLSAYTHTGDAAGKGSVAAM